MSKQRVGFVGLVCLAVLAGSVFAQDREQRRERLRRGAEAAIGVAVDVAKEARTTEGEILHGQVLILRERGRDQARRENRDQARRENEVNEGGLVIVQIADSGSRPPDEIKVDHGRAFSKLGQLRPTRARAGGGNTWILLKAVTQGEDDITVTYKPNDGETDPVTKTHHIMVTSSEVDAVDAQ